MVWIRRQMLTPALALLVALAAANPASAEPGNGAQVVNESDCVPLDPLVPTPLPPLPPGVRSGTVCYEVKSIFDATETPSGNFSIVWHGRSSYDFTASRVECNASGYHEFHFHSLEKDGTLHEEGGRGQGDDSIECFGENRKCTVHEHVHYANGSVQFFRSPGVECTESPDPE